MQPSDQPVEPFRVQLRKLNEDTQEKRDKGPPYDFSPLKDVLSDVALGEPNKKTVKFILETMFEKHHDTMTQDECRHMLLMANCRQKNWLGSFTDWSLCALYKPDFNKGIFYYHKTELEIKEYELKEFIDNSFEEHWEKMVDKWREGMDETREEYLTTTKIEEEKQACTKSLTMLVERKIEGENDETKSRLNAESRVLEKVEAVYSEIERMTAEFRASSARENETRLSK